MKRKISLPLFALFVATLFVTAASFTGVTVNVANFVLRNNGVATNLYTYGTATNDALQVNGAANIVGTLSGSAVTASIALYGQNLTPNTATYANGARALVSSTTTATELGYISGVTSPLQTQLGNLVSRSNGVATNLYTYGIATNNQLRVVNGFYPLAADDNTTLLIGYSASVSGSGGSAIGNQAQSSGIRSLALGKQTFATNNYSVAIGFGAYTTTDNQIVLGRSTESVSIPGALSVSGNVTQSRGVLTYTGGTNVLVDCSLYNDFMLTVTTNTYLLFTNVPDKSVAYTFNLQAKQNATGGYTITTTATNCTGTNLTFSVVANAVTLLSGVNSAFTNGQVVANAFISQ